MPHISVPAAELNTRLDRLRCAMTEKDPAWSMLLLDNTLDMYYFTGTMLGNLAPLLSVPGLTGLGILSLVSWKTAGTPRKGTAILLALVCWAAALASLPIGIAGLLSNFGG